jgi:guanosine-3',5'-bis(diphosphate) 3'-pyrophosphohydrolase
MAKSIKDIISNQVVTVKQIKVADKLCNIRDITTSPPQDWSLLRRTEYLDWSQEVVSGCRGVNLSLEQAFDDAIKKAHEVLH